MANTFDELSQAIKALHVQSSREPTGDSLLFTNHSKATQQLLKCLNDIFMHGLRNKQAGYWRAMKHFSARDIINKVDILKNITTEIGKSCAWLIIALNEEILESILSSVQQNQTIMLTYYYSSAYLCNTQTQLIQMLMCGLEFISFNLNPDVRYFNHSYTSQAISDVGSSVHINIEPLAKGGKKVAQTLQRFVQNTASVKSKSQVPPAHTPTRDNRRSLSIASYSSRSSVTSNATDDNLICFDEPAMSSGSDKPRTNPFNDLPPSYDDNPWDGIALKYAPSKLTRHNLDVLVVDVPIEVLHKRRKSSKSSTKSNGDRISAEKINDSNHRYGNDELMLSSCSSTTHMSVHDHSPSTSTESVSLSMIKSLTISQNSPKNISFPQTVDATSSKSHSTNNDVIFSDSHSNSDIMSTTTTMSSGPMISDCETVPTAVTNLSVTECDAVFLKLQSGVLSEPVENPVLSPTENDDIIATRVVVSSNSSNDDVSFASDCGFIKSASTSRCDISLQTDEEPPPCAVLNKEKNVELQNSNSKCSCNEKTTQSDCVAPLLEHNAIISSMTYCKLLNDNCDDMPSTQSVFCEAIITCDSMNNEKIVSNMKHEDVAACQLSCGDDEFDLLETSESVDDESENYCEQAENVVVSTENEIMSNSAISDTSSALCVETGNAVDVHLSDLRDQSTVIEPCGDLRESKTFERDIYANSVTEEDDVKSDTCRLLPINKEEVAIELPGMSDVIDTTAHETNQTTSCDDTTTANMPQANSSTAAKHNNSQDYIKSRGDFQTKKPEIDNNLILQFMLDILESEEEKILKFIEIPFHGLSILFTDTYVYFMKLVHGRHRREKHISYTNINIDVLCREQGVVFNVNQTPHQYCYTANSMLTQQIVTSFAEGLKVFYDSNGEEQPPITSCPKNHESRLKILISLKLNVDVINVNVEMCFAVHWEAPHAGDISGNLLLKSGKLFRRWRDVYCVVEDGILYQYNHKSSIRPDMSIVLHNCIRCLQISQTDVNLVTQDGAVELRADGVKLASRWMSVLASSIVKKDKSPTFCTLVITSNHMFLVTHHITAFVSLCDVKEVERRPHGSSDCYVTVKCSNTILNDAWLVGFCNESQCDEFCTFVSEHIRSSCNNFVKKQ